MHIETLKPAGLGRLGKFVYEKKLPTPLMLSFKDQTPYPGDFFISLREGGADTLRLYGSALREEPIEEFGILPDYNFGFSNKALVESALEKTLEIAKRYPEYGVTLKGGKFPELWKKGAENFASRPIIRIGHSQRLLSMPRVLVEVLVNLRQILNPNSAVYFPSPPPWALPLLVFLGCDLFDNLYAYVASSEGMYLTFRRAYPLKKLQELPCRCNWCSEKSPESLSPQELLKHNQSVLAESVVLIRESIRNRDFYELVEEISSCSAETSASLRIAYRERGEILLEYAELY